MPSFQNHRFHSCYESFVIVFLEWTADDTFFHGQKPYFLLHSMECGCRYELPFDACWPFSFQLYSISKRWHFNENDIKEHFNYNRFGIFFLFLSFLHLNLKFNLNLGEICKGCVLELWRESRCWFLSFSVFENAFTDKVINHFNSRFMNKLTCTKYCII